MNCDFILRKSNNYAEEEYWNGERWQRSPLAAHRFVSAGQATSLVNALHFPKNTEIVEVPK